MLNPLEVENGPASREMKYKIQKWNVRSKVVHPILVANARVDWMSLDDSDITQQFEILRAGRNPPGCFLTTCVFDMARNATAKTNSVALAARHEQQS